MTPQEVIEFIKSGIENIIKEDDELYGTSIDFILINPKKNDTISIISDGVEKIVEFTPFTKEMETGYSTISEWEYNFDEYLFQDLENGYQIGYMSDNNHYDVWNTIEELYPEDINYKNGVQNYLQYCIDNGITKEYLDSKTGLDTPDIMKYFDKPFLDKESMESEKAYFSFVLGYDLLHDMIKKYDVFECDINYDFCNDIASQFLQTEEYQNPRYSSYEMLSGWVEDNKKEIESKYRSYIGYEEKIYNGNLKIIETGFRKEQPVALVEKNIESMNRKEYIVAFNYTLDKENSNLSWGYGYYYYDKDSGVKAYEKVINGGNLSHNFDKRNIERSR